jgi:serine/threonine-protein kinase
MATEFIDGSTLRHQMASGTLTLGAALDIAIHTAAALAAAHEAGITHRDIKPDNVMLRRDGIVKVLDFGIAKLTEPPAAHEDTAALTRAKVMTHPATVLGTPQYMSPEQARGQVADARSDIFSLGVLLYEMIAGAPPFVGVNVLDVISAILQKDPLPLSQHATEIPSELQRIVSKALRKNRDERYQTSRDLLNELTSLKEELSFAAKQARAGQTERRETATAPAAVVPTPTNAAVATTSSGKIILGELTRHKLGVALTLALLLAVVGALGSFAFFARRQSGPIDSIAVMPFVNESGNAELEYLSDGMTETLINSLSRLQNVTVKARSSVFRYKGKALDSRRIASALNVQAILMGRVNQRGDQLTLSLELVGAQTENVIWSEQYYRNQSDLVVLQSEIARDVSSKLKTRLSGTDEAQVAKKYTADPEAYQLYLKGRYQWNKRTGESLQTAVEFYNQAITKDPLYALAYAGLAESFVLFPSYSVGSTYESMPQSKAAALRSLEIDDSLAEAHTALGAYLCDYAWNMPAGEKEFRRAIELNPNYATAYHWLGNYALLSMGRFDESIAAGRRAEQLDPLSPIISADSGFILLAARRYDEAIAQLKHALTLDPNFYYTRYVLGATYHAKGMYSEAIIEYRKASELDDDPVVTALLARTLAKSGQRSAAIQMLHELRADATRRFIPNMAFVYVYAALGDRDEAFKQLEKDFVERSYSPARIAVDPRYDDLRDDPRFADLVRRVASARMD